MSALSWFQRAVIAALFAFAAALPLPAAADIPDMRVLYVDLPGLVQVIDASYGPDTAADMAALLDTETLPQPRPEGPYQPPFVAINSLGGLFQALFERGDEAGRETRLAAFLDALNTKAPIRSMTMSREMGGCVVMTMRLERGAFGLVVEASGVADPYEGCQTTYGDPILGTVSYALEE